MATLNGAERSIGRTGQGSEGASVAVLTHSSGKRRVRGGSALLALGFALVGLAAFNPSTADAAVQRAAGGFARTSVTTYASLRITTTIHADSNAPQLVNVLPMVFDNATKSWAYPGQKYCTLNYNGMSSSCDMNWLAYPRAGYYFTRMQYSWYTTAGWQSYVEDLGWVYYAG